MVSVDKKFIKEISVLKYSKSLSNNLYEKYDAVFMCRDRSYDNFVLRGANDHNIVQIFDAPSFLDLDGDYGVIYIKPSTTSNVFEQIEKNDDFEIYQSFYQSSDSFIVIIKNNFENSTELADKYLFEKNLIQKHLPNNFLTFLNSNTINEIVQEPIQEEIEQTALCLSKNDLIEILKNYKSESVIILGKKMNVIIKSKDDNDPKFSLMKCRF